jgi:hypothetical protein
MLNSQDTAIVKIGKNDSAPVIAKPVVQNIPTPVFLKQPIHTAPVTNEKLTPVVTDIGFYNNTYQVAPWSHLLSVKNFTFQNGLKERAIFQKSATNTVATTKVDVTKEVLHVNDYINSENNAILVLIISSFILLAWIKVSFGKYINQLLRAVLNYSEAYKLYRDYNTLVERVYLILNIIFTLSGGLFCYQLLKFYKPNLIGSNHFYVLLACFGFILAIYIFKFSINKVLGFILDQVQTFDEYLHSSFIYFKVSGLFLLPLISIISFISDNYRFPFIVIGLIIFFVLYFISIYRATRIMLQKGILLFYWILYLCTVEFLPVILFYKYFNSVV